MATFPTAYLHHLSSLLTVDLCSNCILRGPVVEFCQKEIDMKLKIHSKKAQFVLKGLLLAADFLQSNPKSSVDIFCNSRKQSIHFLGQLEKKLDKLKLSVDVVNINGSLDKIDKFWRIQIFCDNRHNSQGSFRSLVTTNASNVGIDKHPILLQIHFEWPRDLLTYFQERGRGSQLQGVQSTFILYSDLSSYVYLRSKLFAVGNKDDDTSPFGNVVDGFNSAILLGKINSAQPNQKKSYPLGPTVSHSLRERMKKELQEFLCFFCLDLGCLHARGESYLSTRILDNNVFVN
jgi:superfamily II DNA/RNA helicase